ncbi:Hypothetical predicted protein, partial [Paramuricea clavata]
DSVPENDLTVERKVDCLYDLTHKIYNSLNKPTIINGDSEQLYKSDVLNNDNQTENSSRSEHYDLSMDLEGVKLDVVNYDFSMDLEGVKLDVNNEKLNKTGLKL